MAEPAAEEIKPVWVRPATAAKLIDCSVARVYELMGNQTLINRKQDGMRLISFESIKQLGAASAK